MGKILSTISGYYASQHEQQCAIQFMIEDEINQRAIEKIEHDHKWMIEKYSSKPTKHHPYHYLHLDLQTGTFKYNHAYQHIFDATTIKKRLDIFATDENSLRKLGQDIEGSTNIDTLSLSFGTINDFSLISRSFNKLNTLSLRFVTLYGVKMTLKDLVKIIHRCDEL